MITQKNLLLFLFFLTFNQVGFAQPEATRMQWFKDAKLGVFIHWGIYAVNGIDESWAFYNNMVGYEDYMKQLKGFTAKNYRAEEWADLIAESGAKYAVLTSKHHDGVALWDTKANDLNMVKKTPAKRDLLSPFCTAIRAKGLKLGLYFSLIDWSHPDYPAFTKTKTRYEIKNDTLRWQKFRNFYQQQLKEISTQFNPDLYWFDGDWEHTADEWQAQKVRQMLLKNNPNTVINNRLRGFGDYETPEQGLPIRRPTADYWELCLTMNNSWGFQHNDKNYKTASQLIKIFAECVANGGNLLLDIGPKEDGTIPEEQKAILKEFGQWTKKHEEAIFGTVAGLPAGFFYGASSLSKDRKTLYLFVDGKPNGSILVKGLKTEVILARVVGNGTKLNTKVINKPWWSDKAGILCIDLPEQAIDNQLTVIALQLKDKVEVWDENGKVEWKD
jgi:alpha-L-fucosidase